VKVKNLATLPEQYFQKLYETKGYEKLKGKLDELFNSFDPNSPRGAKIFSALSSVFDSLVDVVANIDFDKVATTIVDDVIPAVKTIVLDIGDAFKYVVAEIGKIDFKNVAMTIKNDVLPAVESIAKEIGPTLKTIEEILVGLKMMGHTMVEIGHGVGGGRKPLGDTEFDKIMAQTTPLGAVAEASDYMMKHVFGVGTDEVKSGPEEELRQAYQSRPAVSAAAVAAAAQNNSSQVTFSPGSVNVSVGSEGGEAAGRAAADAFVSGVTSPLKSAFEKIQSENGG